MARTWMNISAVAVSGVFICAVLFCCHGHSFAQGKFGSKSSCCHAKSTKSDSSKVSCSNCPIVTKSVDSEKTYSLAVPASAVHSFVAAQTVHKPQLDLSKSLFSNGPPGFVVQIPLYLQSHSLRI